MKAASFVVEAHSAAKVVKALESCVERLRGPRWPSPADVAGTEPPESSSRGAALVFVCGQLAQVLPELAEGIAAAKLGIPVLIAAGTAVLTQAGEVEDQSAASGLVWTGGRAEPVCVDSRSPEDLGETLSRMIQDRTAKTAPTVLLFPRSEGFSPEALSPLYESRGTPHVFGGGTIGPHGAYLVPARGAPTTGSACLLFLRGISPPQLRTSPACRLLTPLRPVTEVRGPMVLEIDGEPALDVLSEAGQELGEERLMFVALAPEEGGAPTLGGRADVILRGVQGVDPVRRGILVSDEVREGMRLGLAVRDPQAARSDLDAVTRELVR
ncbi:MAG: FIST C-terminal domain-containing protein, partial [Myxococcales bacterium]|nr:FIST C-terminal domain-containing protein [Myxococcales bacterium]